MRGDPGPAALPLRETSGVQLDVDVLTTLRAEDVGQVVGTNIPGRALRPRGPCASRTWSAAAVNQVDSCCRAPPRTRGKVGCAPRCSHTARPGECRPAVE